MSQPKTRDLIAVAVSIVALLWLMSWAVSEAMGSLFGEPQAREEVVLKFKAGEFVPAGGVTVDGKKLYPIKVDDRGYVICSPTVTLRIERAE